MKKIFFLIKSELKRLKKTVIITALILTVFMAALFGVFSVNTDLMRNLCNNLDNNETTFECTAHGATLAELKDDFDGNIVYAIADRFTNATITAQNGKTFDMLQMFEDDDGYHTYMFGGTILFANIAVNTVLKENNNYLSGSWLNRDNEICLSRYVAEALGANIGEKVTVNGQEFSLVGIYDWEDNDDLMNGLSSFAYILTVGENEVLNLIKIKFTSSSEMFSAYRKLCGTGLEISCDYEFIYNNINEMQAALTAVIALLVIVIIIALYSLVTLLFRQRKTHICRMKLLGASDGIVAGVYCGIIILLLLAVVCLAVALGVAFDFYFMYICEKIFDFAFTVNFNFWMPMITFVILSLIVFLLWYLVNRKMKSNSVAEAIRYE